MNILKREETDEDNTVLLGNILMADTRKRKGSRKRKRGRRGEGKEEGEVGSKRKETQDYWQTASNCIMS